MSGKVVGWAMEQRTGSPAAKLVLVKLADNANESGYCWPSVALIVEHTELCDRTVREHLRHLADAGLIRIDRQVSNRGTDRSAYQLNVPTTPGAERPRNSRLATAAKGAGDSSAQATAATGSGSRCLAYKKNRQIEPSLNLPVPSASDRAKGNATALWNGRGAALIEEIGQAYFDVWFADAEFSEGPPATITMATGCKANWVSNHYRGKLERIFGETVQVVVRCLEDRPTEAATLNKNDITGDAWWTKEPGASADVA